MKRIYVRPNIKVNDYITRNGLMITVNPEVSTDMQLAKPDVSVDIDSSESVEASVWDEE